MTYGNIVRGLPIPKNSCDAIYCSHVLEHLSLNDFRTAIRNTLVYLVPGGRFRCVLPDLERLVATYTSSQHSDAAIKFLESSQLGIKNRPGELRVC